MLTAVVAGLALTASQSAQAQTGRTRRFRQTQTAKLQADPQLSNVSVGVAVQDGVVTLTGNVAQASQLDNAENDLSGVQGIVKIIDSLQVNANAPVASAPDGTQNAAATTAQTAQPPQQGQQGNYTYNNPETDNVPGTRPGPAARQPARNAAGREHASPSGRLRTAGWLRPRWQWGQLPGWGLSSPPPPSPLRPG